MSICKLEINSNNYITNFHHTCNNCFHIYDISIYTSNICNENTKFEYNIPCLFCDDITIYFESKYECIIKYIKKPNNHNTSWTIDDEILLLKEVLKNKTYNELHNLLGRTKYGIEHKRHHLHKFIYNNITEFNNIEKTFLNQLELIIDSTDTFYNNINYIFTTEDQLLLTKFIDNIYIIRDEYLSKIYSSKKCIKWLENIMINENIFIQHQKNKGEYNIPNTLCKVDGYCQDTNTIYEFHGCFYHSCIKCYNENDINSLKNIQNKIIYQKTINKENFIKNLKYNLITIWEHDYKPKIKRCYNKKKKCELIDTPVSTDADKGTINSLMDPVSYNIKQEQKIEIKKEIIQIKYPEFIPDLEDVDILEYNSIDYYICKKSNNLFLATEDEEIGEFIGIFDNNLKKINFI